MTDSNSNIVKVNTCSARCRLLCSAAVFYLRSKLIRVICISNLKWIDRSSELSEAAGEASVWRLEADKICPEAGDVSRMVAILETFRHDRKFQRLPLVLEFERQVIRVSSLRFRGFEASRLRTLKFEVRIEMWREKWRKFLHPVSIILIPAVAYIVRANTCIVCQSYCYFHLLCLADISVL